jgi:hypothetical protein
MIKTEAPVGQFFGKLEIPPVLTNGQRSLYQKDGCQAVTVDVPGRHLKIIPGLAFGSLFKDGTLVEQFFQLSVIKSGQGQRLYTYQWLASDEGKISSKPEVVALKPRETKCLIQNGIAVLPRGVKLPSSINVAGAISYWKTLLRIVKENGYGLDNVDLNPERSVGMFAR